MKEHNFRTGAGMKIAISKTINEGESLLIGPGNGPMSLHITYMERSLLRDGISALFLICLYLWFCRRFWSSGSDGDTTLPQSRMPWTGSMPTIFQGPTSIT